MIDAVHRTVYKKGKAFRDDLLKPTETLDLDTTKCQAFKIN